MFTGNKNIDPCCLVTYKVCDVDTINYWDDEILKKSGGFLAIVPNFYGPKSRNIRSCGTFKKGKMFRILRGIDWRGP